MISRILGSALTAAALAVPAGHAFAAPTNAPTAETIQATCAFADGTTAPVTIVTNTGRSGNNENASTYSPGFVQMRGSGLLIPQSFTFSYTIVDNSTGQVVDSGTMTSPKGNAQSVGLGAPATCTFGQTQDMGAFTMNFTGTVTAVQNTHAHA
jgi:hypothetical protein